MASQKLKFTKENDIWVTRFVTKKAVIHMNREKWGVISVLAQAPDNDKGYIPIADFQNPYTPNAIFQIDLPMMLDIEITSQTEVSEAWIITED